MELNMNLANTSLFTYGAIGLTGIILAIATVYDKDDSMNENEMSSEASEPEKEVIIGTEVPTEETPGILDNISNVASSALNTASNVASTAMTSAVSVTAPPFSETPESQPSNLEEINKPSDNGLLELSEKPAEDNIINNDLFAPTVENEKQKEGGKNKKRRTKKKKSLKKSENKTKNNRKKLHRKTK